MSEMDVESGSRRTLAAIVFTDIADFSARMGQDEDGTLKLVRRDLSAITATCEQHHGKVLKSTGDGLLMYFDSAVQAVACALKIQQELAASAKTLPPEQVLRHRIGIHLGDVFVTESDVMGDGVNVAARLQAEAEPGGICISQTVYDVVKNRLAVKATYLGPRDLKNIKDAVPVYQILQEAQTAVERIRRKVFSLVYWRWWAIGAATVAVLLAVLGVSLVYILKKPPVQEPRTPVAATTASGATPAGSGAASSTQPGASVVVVRSATPEAPVERADPALEAARQQYFPRYDFQGMAKWLERNGKKGTPLYEGYARLVKVKTLTAAQLAETSQSKPMAVEMAGPQGPVTYELWEAADGRLNVKCAGVVQQKDLQELEPGLTLRLYQAVLRHMPSASADLQRGIAFFGEEARYLKLLRD